MLQSSWQKKKSQNIKHKVLYRVLWCYKFFFFLKQWSYLGLMVLQLMYTFESEINF